MWVLKVLICFKCLPTLQIYLCGENDDYLPLAEGVQRAMVAEGKICFKTCSKQMKIPAPYLFKLATQEYPTPGPLSFDSFSQAFEHWILTECLASIGSHSIL